MKKLFFLIIFFTCILCFLIGCKHDAYDSLTNKEDGVFKIVFNMNNTNEEDVVVSINDGWSYFNIPYVRPLEKPDHSFIGWSISKDDKSEVYFPGLTYDFRNFFSDGNTVTLYAVWIPDEEIMSFTYQPESDSYCMSSLNENVIILGIPDSYKGKPVTHIGKRAFDGCAELIEISIPNSIANIEDYAFSGCERLSELILPENLMHIGSGAFYGCKGLSDIRIPSTVMSIGTGAFSNCEGLSVIFEDGTTSICDNALRKANVISVELPQSVTSIGKYAFFQCTGLTEITIPPGVTKIGSGAFGQCIGLSIKLENGITSIPDEAFSSYACPSQPNYLQEESTDLDSIEIPQSLTTIGKRAFYNCQTIKEIVIPENVNSIGSEAFSKCSRLLSVVIPDGVTEIKSKTFFGCTNLLDISIPPTILSIGDSAFENCKNLRTVILPYSVTRIWAHAFSNCSELRSITIPSSVVSIGDGVFSECRNLQRIVYGSTMNNWESISKGSNSFYGAGDFTVYCTDGVIDYEERVNE